MPKLTGTHFAAALACAAALLAGCGDDEADTGGGGGASKSKEITGAKVIDPGAMDGAKGNVSFCTGKDTSGSKTAGVKAFNKANPGITVSHRAGQVAPVSPVYPQISQAIYKNVNQALSGAMSPEDALKKAQSGMEQALKTF